VRRRWTSFDREVTNREFRDLPTEDFLALTEAMLVFRKQLGVGYKVKHYGGGLAMITDSGRGQGRCLFFASILQVDEELLVALLVYKKESRKAPASVIKTALARKLAAEANLENL
jgi:hypothetical protein